MFKKLLTILIAFCMVVILHSEDLDFAEPVEEATVPKYIFVFIGNGMGKNHPIMTQYRMQQQDSFAKVDFLEFPVQLHTKTHSANKEITDAAAGATAIACGVKTNNGFIGLDSDGNVVENIAELAKKNNRKVGLISSSNLNNVTLAAFFSHTKMQKDYYTLGYNLIKADYDFIAGGVLLNHTIANKKRLYDLAEEQGYTILRNLKNINELNIAEGEKILATVPRRMEYNRHPRYGDVALAELVQFGIDFLMNENGFVMVVESGLIGINSHANQSNAVIGEMEEFNEAVNVAYEFVKHFPSNSLIIVTGDRDTGELQTMDNRNFYWKSYGNSSRDVISYIYGFKQEVFAAEGQDRIENSDIGLKLKEFLK